jgi:hypothetical protein
MVTKHKYLCLKKKQIISFFIKKFRIYQIVKCQSYIFIICNKKKLFLEFYFYQCFRFCFGLGQGAHTIWSHKFNQRPKHMELQKFGPKNFIFRAINDYWLASDSYRITTMRPINTSTAKFQLRIGVTPNCPLHQWSTISPQTIYKHCLMKDWRTLF